MNRTWKILMDVLVLLFYVNVAGAIILLAQPKGQQLQTTNAVIEPSLHKSIDPVVKRYARLHGLDWRLIYAMINVESRFEKNAVSYAGAVGLMQVLPQVAKEFDTQNLHEPTENIRIGVAHLSKYLQKIKGHTRKDQILMALAAYNGGIGHIYDAKRLASQRGLDPFSWNDVATVLPELELPEVYENTQHGYCQGQRMVRYVEEIQDTYQQYQSNHPALPMIEKPDLERTLTRSIPKRSAQLQS
ncbi:MAG: transglycosylase SLT domain-containing protein [Bdellovibrionales bacterium]|nr:transglycosylase SLT domain-containing protein [Bdellovibrionales bacterium]